ncbi:WD domain, G-beta repeat family protein [Theileria equi strain WA]|uniref:WD domain, G-beta repeat family protein n=1 Tax=Theileria equi strain WA TaxID=1537102 RepID=L0B2F6_THEEQ|nr:WD domain, G-beta repeat family protein [Theileria equi strain WA]AFZ81391.1 WD domain, G-beta repeat family protein [Theileria equi strain WA]|eukprot:XP_004831057.1 WD domain, G-beta repeat family protein [Theileria equi strain WA]
MSIYSLGNVCGAPYTGGRISFSPDGGSLLAPVGNRVTIYDLQTNKSTTLSSETRSDLVSIVCHPTKPLANLIDEDGYCYVLNLLRDKILHRLNLNDATSISARSIDGPVGRLNDPKHIIGHASFSPDTNYFAVAIANKLMIWTSPQEELCWKMKLHRKLTGHMDKINHLDWSSDSKFIITSSKDMTVRLWSVDPIPGFVPSSFVDHRRSIKSAFFTKDMGHICSISREGVIILWKLTEGTNVDNAARSIGSRRKRNAKERVSYIKTSANEEHPFCSRTWIKETQGYCNQPEKALVSRISYNKDTNIFVVGFTGGTFGIYEIPELKSLYTLRIGNELPIVDSVDITKDGDWLGLACSETGTLVVWEWKSETYIMKQQAHYSGVRCVSFSTSGSHAINIGKDTNKDLNVDIDQNYGSNKLGMGSRYIVATGGFDGKIKLWDSNTGLCYVTFQEHTASVEAICFTPQANAIISASLDGTVRAYDLLRYRNFRVLTASRVQYTSVTCDSSGTIVAAGSMGESYSIFIWDLQTGKELDELHGHTAPISSVVFHPHPAYSGFLVSSSWDKYINIWNIFGRADKGGSTEPLLNSSSIIATAFDPRGNSILAASILCGHVVFWDLDNCEQIGSIDGIRDIQSGREYSERFSAINIKNRKDDDIQSSVNKNQHFNSIAYSSSGRLLICGSRNSPHVCIYSTGSYILVYMFTLTHNRSLSGITRVLNSKYMTEYGYSLQEYDLSDDEHCEGAQERTRIKTHKSLPGVKIGEFKKEERFHVWSVSASSDGRQFAAATTHGLYIYSLDSYIKTPTHVNEVLKSVNNFEPQLLTKNVTTTNVISALEKNEYTEAFILALALNNFNVLLMVYENVPVDKIQAIVSSIDTNFIGVLLNFIRNIINNESPNGTIHLGFHLAWLETIFNIHMRNIGDVNTSSVIQCGNIDVRTMMLLLLRQLRQTKSNIVGVLTSNAHTVDYIRRVCEMNVVEQERCMSRL